MALKQVSLKSFFKRKADDGSESEAQSGSDSEYVLSKQKKKFDRPMSWTRVKEIKSAMD
jgi:hypothetical protein